MQVVSEQLYKQDREGHQFVIVTLVMRVKLVSFYKAALGVTSMRERAGEYKRRW